MKMQTIYLYGIFILAIGICLIVSSCSKPDRDTLPDYTAIRKSEIDMSPMENEVVRMINEHRINLGLPPLIPEVLASQVCKNGLIEDESQGERANHSGWSNRIKATNGVGSEILAVNHLTAQHIFDAFMTSPEDHKGAIERTDITHIGISIMRAGNVANDCYALLIHY